MTYKPGDQPEPEFTAFFAGDWQRLLERVIVPGTDGAISWDRKAAWLYWNMALEAKAGWDGLAEEGGARNDPISLAQWIRDEERMTLDEAMKDHPGWPVAKSSAPPPVGTWSDVIQRWDEIFSTEGIEPAVNHVDPNGDDTAD